MSWFENFLANVEFIRQIYVAPLFAAISIAISSVLTPLVGDNFYHEFTKPEETAYVGETMELTPDYVIVIGKNASASEETAAQKLQYYLNEISGVSLEIVRDDKQSTEKEIIIGKTTREGKSIFIDRSNLGDDGIVIRTVGEKLVLSGAEKRGAIYAVYNFLEEYFDCHWFTYDLTVIPKAEKLIIPKNIDYSYAPKITYRSTDWISPRKSNEYKAANGLNDCVYGYMSKEYGGGISYAGSFAHSMELLVDTSLFATEPEIFALGVRTGERTVNQLCLTNPRTLEIVKQSVRSYLQQNPEATIVSVTQKDNQDYCVCENCKRVDAEEGSHAGSLIRFVNEIADDIKEDYPNVYVDTFAYQYTRTPPKITIPRDNVIIRLCSIECKFSTPLNSGDCKENEAFAEDIRQWSKICKNLHIWDYTTNYNHYLAPFANFDVLQENMKFFAENNVIGVYEEGNYTAEESDGEFAELRCYMLAKLMWNPDADIDKLMYDFCEAYYGDGAQGVIDFINFMDKNSGGFAIRIKNWWVMPIPNEIKIEIGTGIYTSVQSAATLRLKNSQVGIVDEMWQRAKNGAKTDWQRENVERSEICWRYWKSCIQFGEFSQSNENNAAEGEKLYNDFKRFGITRLCEGSEDCFVSDNPDFSQPAHRWT